MGDNLGTAILAAAALVGMVQSVFAARRTGTRARRWALLSLACGLATLIVPEMLLRWPVYWSTIWLPIVSILRILIGIAGVMLGVGAIVLGRPNPAWVPLVFGILGSVAGVGTGAGMWRMTALTRPSGASAYQPPNQTFRFVLPSRAWRELPSSGDGKPVQFLGPNMVATIQNVSTGLTRFDFGRAVADLAPEETRHGGRMRDGVNPTGHAYHCETFTEVTDDGPLLRLRALTFIEPTETLVDVAAIGLASSHGKTFRAVETGALDATCERLCLAIE